MVPEEGGQRVTTYPELILGVASITFATVVAQGIISRWLMRRAIIKTFRKELRLELDTLAATGKADWQTHRHPVLTYKQQSDLLVAGLLTVNDVRNMNGLEDI